MKKDKKFRFDLSPRSHEKVSENDRWEQEITSRFGIESAKTSSLYILTLT